MKKRETRGRREEGIRLRLYSSSFGAGKERKGEFRKTGEGRKINGDGRREGGREPQQILLFLLLLVEWLLCLSCYHLHRHHKPHAKVSPLRRPEMVRDSTRNTKYVTFFVVLRKGTVGNKMLFPGFGEFLPRLLSPVPPPLSIFHSELRRRRLRRRRGGRRPKTGIMTQRSPPSYSWGKWGRAEAAEEEEERFLRRKRRREKIWERNGGKRSKRN